MKKFPFILLLLCLAGNSILTSCDTTSNSDPTYSSDCIISAAALGKLKGYVHTKNSAGEDSTYTYTITGSLYPLTIDQINNRIYNLDSLPVGTDASKIVFTALNSSYTTTIKGLASQADSTFLATDSTDFRQPRILTAHSQDGTARRDYTVEIRVHREEADSFAWRQIAAGPALPIAAYVKCRAVSADGKLYVFGQKPDGTTEAVITSAAAPDFTRATAQQTTQGAGIDVRSVQPFKGAFYALSAGHLIATASPEAAWAETAGAPAFDALVGVYGDSLFALSDNKLYATSDGQQWRESDTDRGAALPVREAILAGHAGPEGQTHDVRLLVGQGSDGKPSLWCGYVDRRQLFGYPWMYLPQTEELKEYGCPAVYQPSLVGYDGKFMLIGLDASGTPTRLYTSSDNGRTWKDDGLKQPVTTGATAVAMTVDASQYLWVVCSGTGTVYKGRINRLGWQQEDTRFE